MRENTGVVLWILVFAFGILWVLQDSGAFDSVGATGGDIAVVDGMPISYEDYARAVDSQLQRYQAQTGESAPPQLMDLQREQVFNALVEDRLLEREMDRLGVTVTDDEVYNMILGPNPHPIIVSNFSDGQGGVNRALLENFVDDPEARQSLIDIESYLRAERRRQKMNNLIGATVRVSEADLQEAYERESKTVQASYVALRYAAIPDDSVQVTDADLRAFYNDNRDEYARETTYALTYATLRKDASAADTAAVLDEMEELREQFITAEDDSLFLVRNASETPYTDAYFTPGDLDAALATAVFDNLEPGAVAGPVMANGQVHLLKVRDVRTGEDTHVRARHILFRATETDQGARNAALEEARDVRQRILAGEDFAALAREFSDDGSAAQGGDLGWFGRGRMVEPFEDAAFAAPVGRVTQPVESRFGVHLIEVTERSTQEVQLADYSQSLRASVATLNDLENTLGDLQYFAEESNDFTGEAERLGVPTSTVQVEAGQQFIPGIGNSRALTNFLEAGRAGTLSDVIELNDLFIVAELTEVQPEGFRPFEEVQEQLRPRVLVEQKKAIQLERMRAALETTPSNTAELATRVGIAARTTPDISLTSPAVGGIGREPAFIGTAFGLEQGVLSGIVEGNNAAYVLQVTTVNEPPMMTEADRTRLRDQLLNERRQQVQRQWIANLREKAEVDDRRRLFQQ
ncbi:MAG: peptidylprolyl isomerase [Bacteroidota bacterium]